jgi:hypothetical protein
MNVFSMTVCVVPHPVYLETSMTDIVTHEFESRVKPQPVTLTIKIGDGQLGVSNMWLDRVPLPPCDPVDPVSIGDGVTLVGRTLLVHTTVSDVNAQSNRASVTYTLSGVVGRSPVTVTHNADTDDEFVLFVTTFRFVQ